MKFRLLRGRHVDENGTHKKGAVINSKVNLVERFGPQKFERLYEQEKAEANTQDSKEDDDTTYDDMTVAELRRFAEEEEIDLEGATRKDEIVLAIKQALA